MAILTDEFIAESAAFRVAQQEEWDLHRAGRQAEIDKIIGGFVDFRMETVGTDAEMDCA